MRAYYNPGWFIRTRNAMIQRRSIACLRITRKASCAASAMRKFQSAAIAQVFILALHAVFVHTKFGGTAGALCCLCIWAMGKPVTLATRATPARISSFHMGLHLSNVQPVLHASREMSSVISNALDLALTFNTPSLLCELFLARLDAESTGCVQHANTMQASRNGTVRDACRHDHAICSVANYEAPLRALGTCAMLVQQ